MAQVTAKFKLIIKDVKDFSLTNFDFLDKNNEIYFTVSSDSLEGVNNEADETIREFIASANIDGEDKVEIEKFVK